MEKRTDPPVKWRRGYKPHRCNDRLEDIFQSLWYGDGMDEYKPWKNAQAKEAIARFMREEPNDALFFVRRRTTTTTAMEDDKTGGEEATTQAQSVFEKPTWAWLRENKLRTIGAVWVAGVAGGLMYNMSRPIPFQLKVIHSRVYAQAITLTALSGAALVETLMTKHTGVTAARSGAIPRQNAPPP